MTRAYLTKFPGDRVTGPSGTLSRGPLSPHSLFSLSPGLKFSGMIISRSDLSPSPNATSYIPGFAADVLSLVRAPRRHPNKSGSRLAVGVTDDLRIERFWRGRILNVRREAAEERR